MTGSNGPPGSFAAPEGIYTAAAITLPLAELPVSGNVPLAMVPASTSLSGSHDSMGLAVHAHQGGSGTSSGMAAATTAPASGTGASAAPPSNSASSSGIAVNSTMTTLVSMPPNNVLPAALLPSSWRKELGCTVMPSLSSCSIKWGSSGSSNSDFTGALIAGVGVVGGRRKEKSGEGAGAGGDVSGSGVGTSTATAGRRLRKGSNFILGSTDPKARPSLSEYRGPNPVIEGVMISQGVDAPASSTTGGVGGMIGMSALTSYAFLPNPSGRDLFDVTSVIDMRDEAASMTLNPASIFKPAKNAVKPKNNMRQSNSSFVIRTWVHPELKDILSSLEKAYNSHDGALDKEERREEEATEPSCYHQPPFYVTQRGRTLMWLLPHLPKSTVNVSSASGALKDQQGQQPTVLVRILFASPPSSHDINQLTRSPTTLDVVVGFPTGDLLWLDLISLRYSRFNKGGCCTESGITKVRWLPSTSHSAGPGTVGTVGVTNGAVAAGAGSGGGEGLFVSAHVDGSMLIWDREREDAELGKGWVPRPWRLQSESANRRPSVGSAIEWDPKRSIIVSRPGLVHQAGASLATNEGDRNGESINVSPSVDFQNGGGDNFSSSDPTNTGNVMPTPSALLAPSVSPLSSKREEALLIGEDDDYPTAPGKGATHQTAKWDKNPVTHWKVSRSKINDFAISPDLGCIAVVSEDSLLRIIDLTTESLIASHSSYFGSFLSLAFSPDGRFLLTASCDDLVSLYQPRPSTTQGVSQPTASRLLARCVGHSSWVRGVAFDPYRWREGDRTYRFGSVGEDGKVCLWDFAGGRSLGRTRTTGGPSSSLRGEGKRPASIHLDLQRRGRAHDRDGSDEKNRQAEEQHDPLDVYHPAPSRSAIPTLQPVTAHQLSVGLAGTGMSASLSPLIAIRFSPKGILVLHENGVTVSWDRPKGKRTLVVQQVEEEEGKDDDRTRRQRKEEQGKTTTGHKGTTSAMGAKGAAGLLSKGWESMRGGLTRTMSSGPQSPQATTNAALPAYGMPGNLSAGQV